MAWKHIIKIKHDDNSVMEFELKEGGELKIISPSDDLDISWWMNCLGRIQNLSAYMINDHLKEIEIKKVNV